MMMIIIIIIIIKLFCYFQPLNRMEFYIELIDDDSGQPGEENNEPVDRFVILINFRRRLLRNCWFCKYSPFSQCSMH